VKGIGRVNGGAGCAARRVDTADEVDPVDISCVDTRPISLSSKLRQPHRGRYAELAERETELSVVSQDSAQSSLNVNQD